MRSFKPVALTVVALIVGLPFVDCFVAAASAKDALAQARCCASGPCNPGAMNPPDCCKKLRSSNASLFAAENRTQLYAPTSSVTLAVLFSSPSVRLYRTASLDELLEH